MESHFLPMRALFAVHPLLRQVDSCRVDRVHPSDKPKRSRRRDWCAKEIKKRRRRVAPFSLVAKPPGRTMSSLFAAGSSSKKPYGQHSTPSRLNHTPASSSRHHHLQQQHAAPSAAVVEQQRPHATTTTLSPDQQTEIREAFELFDLDKDSRLDYHEFKVALRALGFDLKKSEVLKLMRDAPASATASAALEGGGGGPQNLVIGWDSFSLIAEDLILSRDPLEEIRRAFRLFDDESTLR